MERSNTPECIDDPNLPAAVLADVHRSLISVHRFLGNTAAVVRAVRRDPHPVRRLLDIGCGCGGMLPALHQGTGAEVLGVDLRAAENSSPHPIYRADALRDRLPESDVAIAVCLIHHLTESEFALLVSNVRRSCRRFLILDLVRHRLPLALFRLGIAPWVHPITAADGIRSIHRAYTPAELRRLVSESLRGTTARFRQTVAPFYIRQVIDITFE